MKQIMQDMANGQSMIVEAPAPEITKGHLLIDSSRSLISVGTERMLVDFGKANMLDKARQQPEKVKMVLEKVKTDGLLTTIDAVKSKLAQPIPLGYCNVGVIKDIGEEVEGFSVGERVVSNGNHADVVRVPKRLCAKIPDGVSDEEASFTVVGSIGLQGIRLANPTLGEYFVVVGVGLIGLLTVQMLLANGCKVLAIDFDEKKLKLAEQFGAKICCISKGQDPVASGMAFSKGIGVDGVIITASTKSNDPVTQAARMSRKRGRIILVGVTGLELNRADFYEKELSFQVSCSYGPGRYDSQYEEHGNDYPLGFVRWTEQRNFEAILAMFESGTLDVNSLITHRFEFENAVAAYNTILEDKTVLGALLCYSSPSNERHSNSVEIGTNRTWSSEEPVLGFVGAGNYSSRVLIPAFKAARGQLHTIVTDRGINGVIHGRKSGFLKASSSVDELMSDKDVNTAIIVTRHNTHAEFVNKALSSGKNVFVEKPLAISMIQLEAIESTYNDLSFKKPQKLMVGFNRRFSPHAIKMKQLLDGVSEPKSFVVTVNAGHIPSDHWTQDPLIGGGRLIGEACHFIDIMRFFVGCKITSFKATAMQGEQSEITEDNVSITLGFADGSMGTILYLANGDKSFPKERIEIFTAQKVLQLDNFIRLKGYGWKGFGKLNLWKQNKGQEKCAELFLESIRKGTETPIPADEIFEVARVSLQLAEMVRSQC